LKTLNPTPGNGMASEASKPQDLVHGRAADRALRPRGARMTKLTNSTRGQAGGKFSASQSIEITRNRKRISEIFPARRLHLTASVRGEVDGKFSAPQRIEIARNRKESGKPRRREEGRLPNPRTAPYRPPEAPPSAPCPSRCAATP
jgi:hypothetical protein